jgi:hypothetical protein
MRNLQFTSCITGIQTNWDWGITFQQLFFFSVGIAIDARGGSNSGPNSQPFGSMSILDSTFQSVNIGVFLPGSDPNGLFTQIYLDNVAVAQLPAGSTAMVGTAGGQQILQIDSAQMISSWARGTAFLGINDRDTGTSSTAQNLPHEIGPNTSFNRPTKSNYRYSCAGNPDSRISTQRFFQR